MKLYGRTAAGASAAVPVSNDHQSIFQLKAF